jgi:hypothetical protein
MIIVPVLPEVVGELKNALGEDSYLDFRGARVAVVRGVAGDDLLFLILDQGHALCGYPCYPDSFRPY